MTNQVVKDIDWSDWNKQPESRFPLLAPERRRCRTCRRYFSLLVYWGAYCSRQCAGRPSPSDDVIDWPRKHHFGGIPKRFYCHPGLVVVNGRSGVKTLYFCDYCGGWHVGSKNPHHSDTMKGHP